MRLTKYAQSCVLIESDGAKIVIDPGNLLQENGTDPEEFKGISAVLLTHKHSDHCFPDTIKIIKQNNPQAKIFANSEVVRILKEQGIAPEKVKAGDSKKVGEAIIDVVEAHHGFICTMKGNDSYPQENVGYVVKAEGKSVYHASDTLCYDSTVESPDIALLPVSGHAVVMEPKIAVEFAGMIKAKLTVPIHYHSLKHPLGSGAFEQEAKKAKLKFKVLDIGESIEV